MIKCYFVVTQYSDGYTSYSYPNINYHSSLKEFTDWTTCQFINEKNFPCKILLVSVLAPDTCMDLNLELRFKFFKQFYLDGKDYKVLKYWYSKFADKSFLENYLER